MSVKVLAVSIHRVGHEKNVSGLAIYWKTLNRRT